VDTDSNPESVKKNPLSRDQQLRHCPHLRLDHGVHGRRRNRKREGVCLFVFHIPPEVTEEELAKVFSQYGSVVSVKIMMHEPGSEWLERRRRQGIAPQSSGFPDSRGYGFVNMGSYDDAKRAITKLNGAQLRSKYLKVSFKKPKSMRRRHLERPAAPRGKGDENEENEENEEHEEHEEHEEEYEGESPRNVSIPSVASMASMASVSSASAVASPRESAAAGVDNSGATAKGVSMAGVGGVTSAASGSSRSKISASSPSQHWTGVVTASLSLQ